MSRKKTLWFGTEEYREWVMCPDQGLQMNAVRFGNSGTYVNGGAWADSSAASHREYNATFSGNAEDVQQVLDFADGQFGNGPFYMVDPFSQNTNSLAKWVASPRLMAEDAPSFTATRPTLTDTPANAVRLPTKSAVFTVNSGASDTFRFPIPTGFTAHLKWWGSTTGTAALHANTVSLAADTAATRTGAWLDLTLAGTGTITIAGVMCQLRATGDTPAPDFAVFKSGRGTTAVAVTGTQLTGYSAIRGRVSATVDLLEVGGWL